MEEEGNLFTLNQNTAATGICWNLS